MKYSSLGFDKNYLRPLPNSPISLFFCYRFSLGE